MRESRAAYKKATLDTAKSACSSSDGKEDKDWPCIREMAPEVLVQKAVETVRRELKGGLSELRDKLIATNNAIERLTEAVQHNEVRLLCIRQELESTKERPSRQGWGHSARIYEMQASM